MSLEPDKIQWKCSRCSQLTDDGLIVIEWAAREAGRAAHQAEQAETGWKVVNLAEFMEDHDAWAGRWEVTCFACDIPDVEPAYWIRVERCQTWRDAVQWMMHLSGKRWWVETDCWVHILSDADVYAVAHR